MTQSVELVVVGAGVIGLSAAREAAKRGLSVTVVERRQPGLESSWAAAGMLAPFAEAAEAGPFLDFGLANLAAYPDWVRQLEEESGVSLEYRECGKLHLAFSEREAAGFEERARWIREFGGTATLASRSELRAEFSGLSHGVRAGLHVKEDHRLDNRALTRALTVATADAGAEIRAETRVAGILSEEGCVTGVRLADGARLSAERILLAAGAWSGQVEGLPGPLPIHPVRGQMLALRPETLPTDRVLESAEVYLVPCDDGRLLVGATAEEVGFRPGTTAGGLRRLLAGALRVIPGLADAALAELWSGLRPGTPDGHPVLGEAPGVRGLFYGTGHFRNGILMAPLSGRALAERIVGTSETPIPEEFSPTRFRATTVERGAEQVAIEESSR